MFEQRFSLEIPVRLGNLTLSFFVSDSLYAVGADCVSTPHNHGSHYELRYVLRGQGRQMVGNTTVNTSPGELLLIYPGEYHYQSAENIRTDLTQYNLRFALMELPQNAPSRQRRAHERLVEALRSTRVLQDAETRMAEPFRRLTEEIRRRNDGYFYVLQAMCTVILTELLRLLPEFAATAVFPAEELKYNGYWRLQIDRFLSTRYGDDVRLQDLADAVKLSKRQTERLMQREYGMGYSQKLTETRIQFARYQIRHTNKPLRQIAMDCGFQSYGYFWGCFRRITGISPGEARKMQE